MYTNRIIIIIMFEAFELTLLINAIIKKYFNKNDPFMSEIVLH